ncbi:MAG: hypothetical protein LBB48_01780 [Treponema sp.]|jgi:hypothetical protein|nr:hypothetical protein [Treponema sp.]
MKTMKAFIGREKAGDEETARFVLPAALEKLPQRAAKSTASLIGEYRISRQRVPHLFHAPFPSYISELPMEGNLNSPVV